MDARIVDVLCHYVSPLGGITLAGSGNALTGLWFDGQARFGSTLDGPAAEGWLPVFDDACRWLDRYFRGEVPDFTPRLDLRGTPFQKAVWDALLQIPYGETMTYGELARQLHSAPRAVGGAVGRNPVPLIVPCHR
ncbi:MAG: methylated-DNA--[protein]-cysteine S-methyltransferase, partial [Bacteroidales bacterium]|nr:methylated-DNA--[protein]-cysteine S-methyltransferase [Bacteroidales bacterium]